MSELAQWVEAVTKELFSSRAYQVCICGDWHPVYVDLYRQRVQCQCGGWKEKVEFV